MGSISVSALLDSGATDCFVDKRWAQERCLRLLPLPKKVLVLNMDGTTNCLWCYATNLGKTPMILGHTWLKTQPRNRLSNWESDPELLPRRMLSPTRVTLLLRPLGLILVWVPGG
ncbi:hypothetical protein ID866_10137 [Astraeus odoratus]|nr:hypothetical protein ID866_10137 [Astraeus odoratus]